MGIDQILRSNKVRRGGRLGKDDCRMWSRRMTHKREEWKRIVLGALMGCTAKDNVKCQSKLGGTEMYDTGIILSCGIITESELIFQTDLAVRLFDWFNFETCSEENKVLILILQLLKADKDGVFQRKIITLGGLQVLDKLKQKVTPDFLGLVEEIETTVKDYDQLQTHDNRPIHQNIDRQIDYNQHTNRQEPSERVCQTDAGSDSLNGNKYIVGNEPNQGIAASKDTYVQTQRSVCTTATPIHVEIVEQSPAELQSSPTEVAHQHCHGYFSQRNSSDGAVSMADSQQTGCFQFVILPWQPLIATDCHVLVSVEESLSNTMDLSLILHTCRFFTDVMLQDFPAEVFLQRPAILKVFLGLLDSDKKICESVIKCLLKLTSALCVRIQYYSDPGIGNLKQEAYSRSNSNNSTPSCPSRQSNGSSSSVRQRNGLNTSPSGTENNRESAQFQGYQCNVWSDTEVVNGVSDDSVIMQIQQLNLPQYCLLCLFNIIPHIGAVSTTQSSQSSRNYAAMLAAELVTLLGKCVKPNIWNSSDAMAQEVISQLKQVLVLIGEVLEKYRSMDVVEEKDRLIYLQMLALTCKFLATVVPIKMVDDILHEELRSTLSASLIDLPLMRIFPMLHKDILIFMKESKCSSVAKVLSMYEDVMRISSSMTSAVKVLKNHDKLNAEFFRIVNESLTILLKLLSHPEKPVKLEMYGQCHKYVVAILGSDKVPRLTIANSKQLSFLFNTDVLIEIKQYAEEILIHLLKGKFLLPQKAWQLFLECLIPALPLLQCYADQTTPLGRAVVNIFDPESSQAIQLPQKERAFEKLPDFSSLRGLLLNSICLMDRPVDLGRSRMQNNFYDVGNLCQVVELLQSKGVEPVVRRSALTQISVMLEDNFENYPDSVIPCISILKNLVQFSSKLRQDLSHHASLFSCIVRAIYLYNGDDRLRPDSSVLLALLLYSDFLMPVPQPASGSIPWHRFTLPVLIVRSMRIPFLCHTHWHKSLHADSPVKRDLLENEACAPFLRLFWNIEWFGGLDVVLNWPTVPPNGAVSAEQLTRFSSELRLTEEDLLSLKLTAISQRCKLLLFEVQNATSHLAVMKSLGTLTGHFILHKLVNRRVKNQLKTASGEKATSQLTTEGWWYDLPWADTFKRFLAVLPVSSEDQQLLVSVLQLLNLCLNMNSISEEGKVQVEWITNILKDATQPLPNLITRLAEATHGSDNQHNTSEEVCRELLHLVKVCSSNERMVEDIQISKIKKPEDNLSKSWIHIIKAISQNITFSDAQHFYNLAFLDWMLSSLAHLTGVLGWSKCSSTNTQNLWSELISSLVELVTSFHCGKGGASIASFMGLSITRNAVLCMNHVLCEMQNFSSKGWETIWLYSLGAETHVAGKANLTWLPPLWLSRDPVIRAAALQLVAGFSSTRKGCSQILSGLSTIAEHDEASLVREQAAILLTNLSSHSISSPGGSTLSLCHAPIEEGEEPVTGVQAVLSLLVHCNFYGEVALLLSHLYVGSIFDPVCTSSRSGWDLESLSGRQFNTEEQPSDQNPVVINRNSENNSSNSQQGSSAKTEGLMTDTSLDMELMRTTPSLVKNVCWLLVNLFTLNPQDAVNEVNKFRLIRLLFSCLVTGTQVGVTEDSSLYMDIIEMHAGICSLLSKCIAEDDECHNTFLQIPDCIHSLLSLLDPSLFTAILSRSQGFEALRDGLFYCGHESYILTLLCAFQDDLHSKFCYSALTSLISLLSFESKEESSVKDSHSLQTLFDFNDENESSEDNQQVITKRKSPREIVPPLLNLHRHGIGKYNLFDSASSDQNNRSSSATNKLSEHQSALKKRISLQDTKRTENISKRSSRSLPSDFMYSNKPGLFNVISSSLESDSTTSDDKIVKQHLSGADLCSELIRLYGIYSVQQGSGDQNISTRFRNLVKGALMSLLVVSKTAKKAALSKGLLDTLILQLRELQIKLSLETMESLTRTSDKKRVCPTLREVSMLFGMLTNFLNGDEDVKRAAAELGLADLIHKLWVWCCAVPCLLEEGLKMLATFTASCPAASLTLVLTTAVPGVGLRKTPSTLSLLHALMSLITKEMNLISRVHEADTLVSAFQVLINACQSQECRNTISKKQKCWEAVELTWLEFLSELTFYPEGQILIPKISDGMDLLLLFTSSARDTVKITSLAILRNISFNVLNRPRLLSSGEFLEMIHQKLGEGSLEEKSVVASIVWALVANNQKGKLVIKCSGIDSKLQEALNGISLQCNSQEFESNEKIQMISNVINVIHAESSTAVK
ncbi:hypothetical protein C0J52_10976 [Blattella germanica]|nr:hypothetical protein C0J52_10976 [Blattella germanica]